MDLLQLKLDVSALCMETDDDDHVFKDILLMAFSVSLRDFCVLHYIDLVDMCWCVVCTDASQQEIPGEMFVCCPCVCFSFHCFLPQFTVMHIRLTVDSAVLKYECVSETCVCSVMNWWTVKGTSTPRSLGSVSPRDPEQYSVAINRRWVNQKQTVNNMTEDFCLGFPMTQ